MASPFVSRRAFAFSIFPFFLVDLFIPALFRLTDLPSMFVSNHVTLIVLHLAIQRTISLNLGPKVLSSDLLPGYSYTYDSNLSIPLMSCNDPTLRSQCYRSENVVEYPCM